MEFDHQMDDVSEPMRPPMIHHQMNQHLVTIFDCGVDYFCSVAVDDVADDDDDEFVVVVVAVASLNAVVNCYVSDWMFVTKPAMTVHLTATPSTVAVAAVVVVVVALVVVA